MKITRREFAIGAGALALGGIMAQLPVAGLLRPAHADDVTAELMKPGPLEDMDLGDPKAPITIVEYASMTCPHCAHFSQATFPELKKRYIDTGKVRFIFREFPLDPLAAAGSMLARCAGKDKYFPLIETLFQQQADWVVQKPLMPLLGIAKQAGFTQDSFEKCLNDRKLQADIETERNIAAEKLGVNSTPTLFINGQKVNGAIEIDEMDKLLQPLLKS